MYLQEALANFAATKLRTLLAMIGILVGTASVVAMVSCGELATQAALSQFKSLGTDLLAVTLYSQGNTSSDAPKISMQDAIHVKNVSPNISMVSPYTTLFLPVIYEENQLNPGIIGATQNLSSMIHIKMQSGRFISDLDKDANFCVVGAQIAKNLALLNPLGTQIKLGNSLFTIIGIAADWPENGFFNQDINNAIIIPLPAVLALSKYSNIDNLIIQLTPNADIETVKNNITQYFAAKAPDKKLFFRSAKELIKSMIEQHKIFTILLGLIGSISLLVGGVGVMNIMLVSVLERRREIGIRLALGARRKDIQWMFLSEAVLLSVLGGLMGIILGILITFVISKFASWPFSFLVWPSLVGFSVSVLIGVFFGFYPARQASRLNPIETLRTE